MGGGSDTKKFKMVGGDPIEKNKMVGGGSAAKFKMVGGPPRRKKLPTPHTVIAGIALFIKPTLKNSQTCVLNFLA